MNKTVTVKAVLFLLSISLITHRAEAVFKADYYLSSADGVTISCAYYQCKPQHRADSLIILSPGYAQHHGTGSMKNLANDLSGLNADVLVLSYRGNGKSSGRFTFGADEIDDLNAAYQWGESRYNEIHLLGFSLGAYTAFRFAVEKPHRLKSLMLVSCPTSVEDITLSGGAFLNPVIILFRKVNYQTKPENDLWFRWDWPFKKKPNLSVLADKITVPVHFLIAEHDTLVYADQSRKIAAKVKGKKTVTTFKDGIHAEHMYLQNRERFLSWVESCIKQ